MKAVFLLISCLVFASIVKASEFNDEGKIFLLFLLSPFGFFFLIKIAFSLDVVNLSFRIQRWRQNLFELCFVSFSFNNEGKFFCSFSSPFPFLNLIKKNADLWVFHLETAEFNDVKVKQAFVVFLLILVSSFWKYPGFLFNYVKNVL